MKNLTRPTSTLHGRINGKRARGRQRRRLTDDIKTAQEDYTGMPTVIARQIPGCVPVIAGVNVCGRRPSDMKLAKVRQGKARYAERLITIGCSLNLKQEA